MPHAVVAYVTPSGAHMTKHFSTASAMCTEIKRLHRRRTEAEAWVEPDRETLVGGVWRNQHQGWAWFCDMEAL